MKKRILPKTPSPGKNKSRGQARRAVPTSPRPEAGLANALVMPESLGSPMAPPTSSSLEHGSPAVTFATEPMQRIKEQQEAKVIASYLRPFVNESFKDDPQKIADIWHIMTSKPDVNLAAHIEADFRLAKIHQEYLTLTRIRNKRGELVTTGAKTHYKNKGVPIWCEGVAELVKAAILSEAGMYTNVLRDGRPQDLKFYALHVAWTVIYEKSQDVEVEDKDHEQKLQDLTNYLEGALGQVTALLARVTAKIAEEFADRKEHEGEDNVEKDLLILKANLEAYKKYLELHLSLCNAALAYMPPKRDDKKTEPTQGDEQTTALPQSDSETITSRQHLAEISPFLRKFHPYSQKEETPVKESPATKEWAETNAAKKQRRLEGAAAAAPARKQAPRWVRRLDEPALMTLSEQFMQLGHSGVSPQPAPSSMTTTNPVSRAYVGPSAIPLRWDLPIEVPALTLPLNSIELSQVSAQSSTLGNQTSASASSNGDSQENFPSKKFRRRLSD